MEGVVQAYLREMAEVEARITAAEEEGDKVLIGKLKDRRDAIAKRCNRLRSRAGRKNVLDLASSNSNPLVLSYDQLDQDPYLLGVENGVVDLRNGQLRPGRPEDYITIVAPTTYQGLETPCPKWRQFLLEVLVDQSVIDYLQRLFGYALIGDDLGIRVFPIFYGEHSQNGKGTIKDTLFKILGPVAAPMQSEMLIATKFSRSASSPTPEIMALKGKRVVFASETEKGQRFATAAVKRYSGGDKLQGRGLQDRDFTEFEPTHTMFLLTNYTPTAPADDDGFFNRARIIPFPWSFVENPTQPWEKKANIWLAGELEQEASGILAWLIEGAVLFLKEGGLKTPPGVAKPTEEYRRGQDPVLDFVEACCFKGDDLVEGATNLYLAYKYWWTENINKTPPSGRAFGDAISRHYKKDKKGTVSYFGLEVKPDILAEAMKKTLGKKSTDETGS